MEFVRKSSSGLRRVGREWENMIGYLATRNHTNCVALWKLCKSVWEPRAGKDRVCISLYDMMRWYLSTPGSPKYKLCVTQFIFDIPVSPYAPPHCSVHLYYACIYVRPPAGFPLPNWVAVVVVKNGISCHNADLYIQTQTRRLIHTDSYMLAQSLLATCHLPLCWDQSSMIRDIELTIVQKWLSKEQRERKTGKYIWERRRHTRRRRVSHLETDAEHHCRG